MQTLPDIRGMRVSEAEAALAGSGFLLGGVFLTEPPRDRRERPGRFWEAEDGKDCYRVVRWSTQESQRETSAGGTAGGAHVVDVIAVRVPDMPTLRGKAANGG